MIPDLESKTLLVIMGAGASYDTLPRRQLAHTDLALRPPLTSQLFDNQRPDVRNLLNRFPALQALAARVREPLLDGSNLEALLDTVVEESGQNPHRRRQLMALRFYLAELLEHVPSKWHRSLSGATNYAVLLDRLEQWRCAGPETRRIVYVTFNYDTLIEMAADKLLHFAPTTLRDYIAHQRLTLIRPHGCVDWHQDYLGPTAHTSPDALIGHADQLEESFGPIFHRSENRDGRGYPIPAIAVPLLTKAHFVCPDEHLGVLKTASQEATGILIIGWRGKETHFNQMMRRHIQRPHVMVAASRDSEDILRDLMESWQLRSPLSTRHEHTGFSGLLFGPHKGLEAFLEDISR